MSGLADAIGRRRIGAGSVVPERAVQGASGPMTARARSMVGIGRREDGQRRADLHAALVEAIG